jgi:hypothetical protein
LIAISNLLVGFPALDIPYSQEEAAATVHARVCLPARANWDLTAFRDVQADVGVTGRKIPRYFTVRYLPITYYWTGLLILDHSFLVGKLTSKIAETKALEPLKS